MTIYELERKDRGTHFGISQVTECDAHCKTHLLESRTRHHDARVVLFVHVVDCVCHFVANGHSSVLRRDTSQSIAQPQQNTSHHLITHERDDLGRIWMVLAQVRVL